MQGSNQLGESLNRFCSCLDSFAVSIFGPFIVSQLGSVAWAMTPGARFSYTVFRYCLLAGQAREIYMFICFALCLHISILASFIWRQENKSLVGSRPKHEINFNLFWKAPSKVEQNETLNHQDTSWFPAPKNSPQQKDSTTRGTKSGWSMSVFNFQMPLSSM